MDARVRTVEPRTVYSIDRVKLLSALKMELAVKAGPQPTSSARLPGVSPRRRQDVGQLLRVPPHEAVVVITRGEERSRALSRLRQRASLSGWRITPLPTLAKRRAANVTAVEVIRWRSRDLASFLIRGVGRPLLSPPSPRGRHPVRQGRSRPTMARGGPLVPRRFHPVFDTPLGLW